MEEKVVCRICLKVLDPTKNSFGFVQDRIGTLKEMIMNCIPEMDIYVSPNPIVCLPCIQTLVNLHLFKNKCINTETIIRTYMKRNDLPPDGQVNLLNIVEEMIATGVGQDGAAQQGMEMAQPASLVAETNMPSHLNTRISLNSSPAKQYSCISPLSTNVNRCLNIKTYPSQMKQTNPQFRQPKQPSPIDNSPPSQDFSYLRNILNPRTQPRLSSQYHPYSVSPDLRTKFIETYRPRVTQSFVQNTFSINGDSSTAPPIESPVEPLIVNISDLNGTETPGNVEKESEEVKVKETQVKMKIHPIEQKMRLIVKIPRSLIHIPKETEDECKESDETVDGPISDNVTEGENPIDLIAGNLESQDGTSTGTVATPGTPYHERFLPCPHCSYVAKRSYVLNKHINTVHTRSVWFMCESCDYSTTDKSSLRRHTRTVHADKELNLQCKVCGEQFDDLGALKRHYSIHNSSELRCLFCPYSTRDRSNFRKHIFTHNPTSIQCDFCDYRCVSPYVMRAHLKRLHNSVGIEDVDCKSDTPLSKLLLDITAAKEEAEKLK